jgi:hypothetical protein
MVTLDAQRMVDGSGGIGGYIVTGTANAPGITVAPIDGRFGSGGEARVSVPITVERSVPEEYYLVSLDTTVGVTVRRSVVLVVVMRERDEG